jgi:hypothetical protein
MEIQYKKRRLEELKQEQRTATASRPMSIPNDRNTVAPPPPPPQHLAGNVSSPPTLVRLATEP